MPQASNGLRLAGGNAGISMRAAVTDWVVPHLDIMVFFKKFVVDGRHRSRFSSPRLGLDSRAWEFIAEGAYVT
jgi:hypothetical protein